MPPPLCPYGPRLPLARRRPTRRFTYGLGRVEDLAGLIVVVLILVSGVVAGYTSISRLFDPPEIDFLWAVAAAAIVGFIGNEAVALFRIRIGREIGSAALVADGLHARVDGLTSLAVLAGAIGVWLGAPLADPIAGLVITAAIFRIVFEAGKSVFSRLLDGVEPGAIDEVREVVASTQGVEEVTEVRIRWLGHTMLAEVNLSVGPELSVAQGHEIAQEAHHQLMHHLQYLSNATVHVDPVGSSGEEHHQRAEDHHREGDAGHHGL